MILKNKILSHLVQEVLMLLCIDVGNSHIYAGVYEGDSIKLRFRLSSKANTTDELGIFLKAALRENHCDPELIKGISICSVVPQIDYSLRSACYKYFGIEPFLLQAGVKTGLNIKIRHAPEVGADRIANAIAASARYPQHNLIVIDFGTATTFCAINAKREYLGGAIQAGMRLAVHALSTNTAKLSPVEIVRVQDAIGRSTNESIQAGIYFGALGAAREVVRRMKEEVFHEEPVLVIATGGFAALFEHEALYDVLAPDLVLEGLKLATQMNL